MSHASTATQAPPRLFGVKDFCSRHPWLKEATLRNRIATSDEHGFGNVIRRLGRKILVDETEFFQWLDRQDRNGAV